MKNKRHSGPRLAVIGCGAIGSLVAKLLEKKRSSFRVTAVFDTYLSNARSLSKNLRSHPIVCDRMDDVFTKCDLVLEAASVEAAPMAAEKSLKHQKPIVLMSTGGFFLNRAKLTRLAEKYRTKIYLPSGALCGLDGVKAARQIGKIRELSITSTKPPKGLLGAPGLTEAQKRKLYKTKSAFYLYKGNVEGAIKRFPANVNVAATTALASGYPQKLKVRVMADPKATMNQHEIFLSGDFGELKTITRNVPSRENPKTSALAIQSALALFERLEGYVEVGT